MESSLDIELINQAIQKLVQEKRIKDTSVDELSEEDDDDDDDDDEQLLSKLLSQLESLKGGEEEVTSPRAYHKAEAKSENGSRVGTGCGETDMEEIVKELKAVKRQNKITHCLLSALIVVTMVWQLSEVSIILKLKDGFSHPFRSFGSMLVGLLPSPRGAGINNNVHEADKDSTPQNHNHNPLVPELPHLEFPNLGSNNGGGLPNLEFPNLGSSNGERH